MIKRDGHIRILPLHVANKIAAGEVVERPASVVKELVENSIDAGAKNIRIAIAQGGRKLVSVQDDGVGMSRDDATISLERQATSKILDVNDIEEIDTLGFRGEALPSIASVSRFTMTTRTKNTDEGTYIRVDVGNTVIIRAAGCPVGTLIEVRDLFCNVPARRKFLRAYITEENHVKTIFTIHALAHHNIGFTLIIDNDEVYRLAPCEKLEDRIRDLFGTDYLERMLALNFSENNIAFSGLIERPNLSTYSKHDQYVFINGRPASASAINHALKEAYPKRQGDSKPAAILFINLPPKEVDVNVHPAKREVRFHNNAQIKSVIVQGVTAALNLPAIKSLTAETPPAVKCEPVFSAKATSIEPIKFNYEYKPPTPSPIETELPLVEDNNLGAKPWSWFKFLALTDSGYLLIETDAGVVTINPHAARERLAYEQLQRQVISQTLLIPEVAKLSPPDFARIMNTIEIVRSMGFRLEEFGRDTLKIEAVPQLIGDLSPIAIIETIAKDLAEGSIRRLGENWREKLIAKSIARSFAGSPIKLDEKGAVQLVEELATAEMPYVCPRGKPIMIFTSTRELNRKFARE